VITFPGAIKLMMWLGGNKAKSFRTKVTEIITKYFAGDKTLLAQIQANAESNSAISQAARASLQSEAMGKTVVEAATEANIMEPTTSKKQKMFVPTAEELERCERFKNYVVTMFEHEQSFKRFIDFRKEDAQVDIDKNIKLTEIDEKRMQIRVKEKTIMDRLETKRQKGEVKYKQALKDIENTPAPPTPIVHQATAPAPAGKATAPIPTPNPVLQAPPNATTTSPQNAPIIAHQTAILTAVLDPSSTTTVLKVFNTNKDAFHLIKNEQKKKNFLIKAGHYAAAGYVLRYGVLPQKIIENGLEVNIYPYEYHEHIMQNLFSAYRDVTVGSSQTTIDSIFRPLIVSDL